MKKIIRLTLGLLLAVNIFATAPTFALFEGSKEAVCRGALVSETGGCATNASQAEKANDLIASALNIFTSIVAIIAVVMVIVGGVKYATSQGDSGQVNSAKNTILYAIIGLVVAGLSQVIVRFVLHRFG